jgi:hypothetical protein
MSTIQPRPRCVLIGDITGDNRLSVAVAAQLVARGAAAVVVAGRDQDAARAIREAVLRNAGRDHPNRVEIQATARRSPAVVVVVPLTGVSGLDRLLEREPVALHSAHCLLALAHDAEQNLRVAVVARRVAGEVPVVLRSFDPEYADALEREHPKKDRYVERAYSVAHLSAPSFVAAVLFGRARDHVLTMRVGTEYVSVWEVEVPGAGDPMPGARRRRARGLLGRSPDDILSRDGCQVLARRDADGSWKRAGVACPTAPLRAGEKILLGGPLGDVLDLARSRPGRRLPRGVRRPRVRPAPVRANRSARRVSPGRACADGGVRTIIRWRERLASATMSTQLLLGLGVLVTLASVPISPAHRPGEFLYQWASTALGTRAASPTATARRWRRSACWPAASPCGWPPRSCPPR